MTQSKMSKLLRCGFAYDCHYNKKIRPIKMGSALMFGVAIDEGLNAMVLDNKADVMTIYRDKTNQPEYKVGRVAYGRYDYDKYLLTSDQKATLLKQAKKMGYKGDDLDELFMYLWEKGDDRNLKNDTMLDALCRASLEAKAEIIFQAYLEQVIPQIKKVHAVQKESVAGILDLKIDWKKKGNTVIADNKTSAMQYEDDAMDNAVQLILYAIEENVDKGLFIVIPKKIDINFNKTCKKCNKPNTGSHKTCADEVDGVRCHGEWKTDIKKSITIQFVEGDITESMKKRAVEIRDGIQKIVDTKAFVCNFANCNSQFGKPCDYKQLYWNDSMEGLEDQSKKGK